MKGLIITANVAHTAHQTWGSGLAEAQCKIKSKYLYNKVHDADLIINMMSYLAAADEQHNRQEAIGPKNSETANMVNLGIEQLQQLVQQLPSEYTSANRDDESAMEATSDSKSSVETSYSTRGRKKDKKGRRQRHRSQTPSISLSHSPPRHRSKLRARRSSSRKPDKRDINPDQLPTLQGIWRLWPIPCITKKRTA